VQFEQPEQLAEMLLGFIATVPRPAQVAVAG
jgi:hypothetical protein